MVFPFQHPWGHKSSTGGLPGHCAAPEGVDVDFDPICITLLLPCEYCEVSVAEHELVQLDVLYMVADTGVVIAPICILPYS